MLWTELINMKKESESKIKTVSDIFTLITNIIKFTVFAFFALFILGIFGAAISEGFEVGNVAVIPIEGMITREDSFVKGANSQDIVEFIEEANEDSSIEAILLDINSPGGTPVATDEIAQAVKAANKTVVAVISETGASGAFWIATAADRIFANPMSVTGSIGVQASRLEFGGLLADYNVTYRRLIAGKYKDTGSLWREMTPDEQQMYQQLLDKLHSRFIKTVAENRNLNEQKVRSLATGFVFLGSEAKELGLIDELGGKKEALEYLEKKLNITAEPVEYERPLTFFEELSGVTSQSFYNMGRGLGSLESETKVTLT